VTDAATENARLTQASGGLRLGLLSQVARPDTSMLGPAMASMASWVEWLGLGWGEERHGEKW
jgi:hypothetical protein